MLLQYFSKAITTKDITPLFIDGCAGHGGHSKAIMETFPNAQLLCLDRDPSVFLLKSIY